MSNQWKAVATSSTSTEPSASGIASARPTAAGTAGSRRRNSVSIAEVRLDGDGGEPGDDETRGEGAGAGAEVEHVGHRPAGAGQAPGDRLRGVVGSVVGVRRAAVPNDDERRAQSAGSWSGTDASVHPAHWLSADASPF